MPSKEKLFKSFIHGGLECSTHFNLRRERLDLLQSTRHDIFARSDYAWLKSFGIRTVRSAFRWHLIEPTPGTYDFTSIESLLDAADVEGVQTILDILHFGVPEHIDLLSADFPKQFEAFTVACCGYLNKRGHECKLIAPINEISFLAWAGGEKAAISPFAVGRGHELKRNLVRAAIAASDVLLAEIPGIRLIAPEPAIHIVGDPLIRGDQEEATCYTLAYFECWDTLSGRLHPELGGNPRYLDMIGVNFYWRNEWVHNSGPLSRNDLRWRPFSRILADIWERYRRPLYVAETGTEDDYRAEWFEYICDEVADALATGVPIHGICWYPIINHPGWDDDRHCCNGLLGYADARGKREVHQPLGDAILKQQARFSQILERNYDSKKNRHDLSISSSLGIRVSASPTLDEPVCP